MVYKLFTFRLELILPPYLSHPYRFYLYFLCGTAVLKGLSAIASRAYIDPKNKYEFLTMANSALHAIAVDELRTSNPAFHEQYCLLVEGISKLISQLAKKHGEYIAYSSFTESYDRASKEPILQMVLGSHKNEFYLHIYISKDGGFIVGKNGVGTSTQTAPEALALIEQAIHHAGWL